MLPAWSIPANSRHTTVAHAAAKSKGFGVQQEPGRVKQFKLNQDELAELQTAAVNISASDEGLYAAGAARLEPFVGPVALQLIEGMCWIVL